MMDMRRLSSEEILYLFETFPLKAYQSGFYEAYTSRATERIADRDPKDIDILALTYKIEAPLWPVVYPVLHLPEDIVIRRRQIALVVHEFQHDIQVSAPG